MIILLKLKKKTIFYILFIMKNQNMYDHIYLNIKKYKNEEQEYCYYELFMKKKFIFLMEQQTMQKSVAANDKKVLLFSYFPFGFVLIWKYLYFEIEEIKKERFFYIE